MTILITGGAGFIGSHFAKRTIQNDNRVVVLDKLTYAGNLENLKEIKNHPLLKFYKGDICNKKLVEKILKKEGVETIVNFAAETHVDRSIIDAEAFIDTDVKGTFVLLQAARSASGGPIKLFIQVSTDEVYGSIQEGSFQETDALNPSSPYSASKAAGDRLAYAYWVTYKLPVIILRPCNIYGPNQYPEKFIPLSITNAIEDKKLPLYGDGKQVRDWLYVTDLCEAIELIMQKGTPGEVYNIASNNERNNLEVARLILEILGKDENLVQHIKDREGHDRRYSMSSSRILQLGWKPRVSLEQGLKETIDWYLNHRAWWERIKKGSYSKYYKKQYAHRQKT